MLIGPEDLDAFVAQSDAFGGPGTADCNAYWASFEYNQKLRIDQDQDPYGDRYVDAQLSLYREISGKVFDQTANEQMVLDVGRHVAAVNPYDHPDPSVLALHVERLSRAFRFAKVRRGDHLLDLGCGWGLSSEVGAYLGLRVTGVDINPLFVELVNQRARLGRRNICAVISTFDDFMSSVPYDIVLFYECLHHALKPWHVIDKFSRRLIPGGKIVLAGEPINSNWWKHWGMRLDAMSVYCIRKFGWLESGWSLEFIQDVFERTGLTTLVEHGSDSEVGYTIVGQLKPMSSVAPAEIASRWSIAGWTLDGDVMAFSGNGWLRVPLPNGTRQVRLLLRNCRPKPLDALLRIGQNTIFKGSLVPGDNMVDCGAEGEDLHINLTGEIWCPDEEIHNGDRRAISFHLARVFFA